MGIPLSSVVNTMAADGLATQGAGASEAMVLPKSQGIFKSHHYVFHILISYVYANAFLHNSGHTLGLHPWWRHEMETFSALLALCAGNSPVTGEFPAQRPVTRSFDVSLICVLSNSWANNGNAGGLRRQRAHYNVTLMCRSDMNSLRLGVIKTVSMTKTRMLVMQCSSEQTPSERCITTWTQTGIKIIYIYI